MKINDKVKLTFKYKDNLISSGQFSLIEHVKKFGDSIGIIKNIVHTYAHVEWPNGEIEPYWMPSLEIVNEVKVGQIYGKIWVGSINLDAYIKIKVISCDEYNIITKIIESSAPEKAIGETLKFIDFDNPKWDLLEEAKEEIILGYNCKACKLYYSYVAPNRGNEYVCYDCR